MFVNEPARKAFLAFIIIHLVVTFLPKLIYFTFSKLFYGSCCRTLPPATAILISILLSCEYLWVILFYSFDSLKYGFKNNIGSTSSVARGAQIVLQITFLTIMGINEVNSPTKVVTVALSVGLIFSNLLYIFVINYR